MKFSFLCSPEPNARKSLETQRYFYSDYRIWFYDRTNLRKTYWWFRLLECTKNTFVV